MRNTNEDPAGKVFILSIRDAEIVFRTDTDEIVSRLSVVETESLFKTEKPQEREDQI